MRRSYQTCSGLFVGTLETEYDWLLESPFMQGFWQTAHAWCDVLLFIWSHSWRLNTACARSEKMQFKCKGDRAAGETYLWKIITSEKIWSWLSVPNMLQHFVITSPSPCHARSQPLFQPLWSVQSAGQGRNLNVTIAESIEKLSIELRFCGVKWLFKTSIRFLIRPEWDLISKLILVNDFSEDVKDSASVFNFISCCDRWKPLCV